jgi:hypothetical protein
MRSLSSSQAERPVAAARLGKAQRWKREKKTTRIQAFLHVLITPTLYIITKKVIRNVEQKYSMKMILYSSIFHTAFTKSFKPQEPNS